MTAPTNSKTTAKAPPILKPGWGVALILRQPVNGLACYVGEVQAVDDRGLRITSMHWMSGTCAGMDWWFPWADIQAMEVSTDQHSGWDPARTQERAQRAAGLWNDEGEG